MYLLYFCRIARRPKLFFIFHFVFSILNEDADGTEIVTFHSLKTFTLIVSKGVAIWQLQSNQFTPLTLEKSIKVPFC